jgi:hypothetical protein
VVCFTHSNRNATAVPCLNAILTPLRVTLRLTATFWRLSTVAMMFPDRNPVRAVDSHGIILETANARILGRTAVGMTHPLRPQA